jgi:hypothetical protein
MRRVLNQAANPAVKAKGTIVSIVYRRLVPRLGACLRSGFSGRVGDEPIKAPIRV